MNTTATETPMLAVESLTKRFGSRTAVDAVSFTAEVGDVVGFLGPNGAGKSTTMRMITGFLEPDGGTARVAGHDVGKEPLAVQRRLGYVAENAPSYEEMSVEGLLKFVCRARQLTGPQTKAGLERVAQDTGLQGVWRQPIGTLSKGYRRRVGLAQALVHDPPLLILDEPTDGLDPNQKHEVRRLIASMAKTKCIVVSTHILEEVDAVCSRIILINQGRLQADATPNGLRDEHGEDDLNVLFRKLTLGDTPAKAVTAARGTA